MACFFNIFTGVACKMWKRRAGGSFSACMKLMRHRGENSCVILLTKKMVLLQGVAGSFISDNAAKHVAAHTVDTQCFNLNKNETQSADQAKGLQGHRRQTFSSKHHCA